MKLVDALAIRRGDIVAFTGAGGKTSSLVRLSTELTGMGLRVLATTTTRIATSELSFFPAACHSGEQALVKERLGESGCVFAYDRIVDEKVIGISAERLGDLMQHADADVILVEADGARRMPLKAPYAHEPLVPQAATLVVNMVGCSAFGASLDDGHVYNASGLAYAAGVREGTRIDAAVIAAGLMIGASRFATDERRFVALLNGVPSAGVARQVARRAARLALVHADVERVVICGETSSRAPSCEVRRRICALVLAAGLSRRMGTQKVLLPWAEGETVVQHVVRQVRAAGIDDVLVVTGANAELVRQSARQVCALSVHNDAFETGEMLSSLQTGLRAAWTQGAAAALIVLGDQPSIRHRNVRQILEAYASGQGAIIAPSHNMKRGHPILIDRIFWEELLALPPGSAPRDVINRHSSEIGYVETDDSVLRDIDTPEAYAEERSRAFRES